jgi:hypothetical protein
MQGEPWRLFEALDGRPSGADAERLVVVATL